MKKAILVAGVLGCVIGPVQAIESYFDTPAPAPRNNANVRVAPVFDPLGRQPAFRPTPSAMQASTPVAPAASTPPVIHKTEPAALAAHQLMVMAAQPDDAPDLTDGMSHAPNVSSGVPLPPELDRGLADIETGMGQVTTYAASMARHIRRNGIRGFFNTPPEMNAQGRSIGQTIGRGIRGVADATAQDMLTPNSL